MLGYLTYVLFGVSRSHSLTGSSTNEHSWGFPTAMHTSSAKQPSSLPVMERESERRKGSGELRLCVCERSQGVFSILVAQTSLYTWECVTPQVRISVSVVADPRAGGVTEGSIPLSIKYSF